MRKVFQTGATVVESLGHFGSGIRIVLLNVLDDVVEVVGGGSGPTQAHLRPQDLFQLLAYFLVLYEVSPVSRS